MCRDSGGIAISAASFSYTPGTLDDLPEAEGLGLAEGYAPREVERLLDLAVREPFGFSVVVRRRAEGTNPLVACEIGFLLRRAASARLLTGPEPFGTMVQAPDAGLFPTDEEAGRRNGDGGLDLLVARFILTASLSQAEAARVRAQMPMSFVEMYAGNHVRALLYQVRGKALAARAAAGGFVAAAAHERWHDAVGTPERDRSIVLRFDPSSEGALYNLLAQRLLHYRPPILELPPGAREIVRFALLGMSDVRIVERHGLSAASLNSRWTRALDIAERRMPELFAADGGRTRDRGRLLAYVRDHPEEAWPYAPLHADPVVKR